MKIMQAGGGGSNYEVRDGLLEPKPFKLRRDVVDVRCPRRMGQGDSDSKKPKWETSQSTLGKPVCLESRETEGGLFLIYLFLG